MLKLETSARDFAQTVAGKCFLLAVFGFAFSTMVDSVPVWAIAILALVGCTFAPAQRWRIVATATFASLLVHPFWYNPTLSQMIADREHVDIDLPSLRYAMLAVFFLLAGLTLHIMRVRRIRRPVLSLLVFLFALLLFADSHLVHGVALVTLWEFINVFSSYLWFFAYALIDHNHKQRRLPLQLGAFHAFWNWNISIVPLGKGLANLTKLQAKDAGQLAAMQVRGLALLLECMLLKMFLVIFVFIAHAKLNIPSDQHAFIRQLEGSPYPWYTCWASLFCAFIESVLRLAFLGNAFVACARVAGFNLLRNTYHPFSAATIAEFWNRYYYYFKELLVDFFFYPTFLRCFKHHERLRLLFATFMASCVGNIVFHFFKDIRAVAEFGLVDAITGFQTYAFYALLLTLGICCSQLAKPKPRNALLGRARVWLFFCLLQVFAYEGRDAHLAQHLEFLLHLFGFSGTMRA